MILQLNFFHCKFISYETVNGICIRLSKHLSIFGMLSINFYQFYFVILSSFQCRYSSIIESMPTFWNTPPSSSTSAAQDFPDQFSPTSSNATPFKKYTFDQFSDSGATRRSQSQVGMMEALMSPRQVLSPSSSKIIHPSQSASLVGAVPSGYASRYLPRQISLDNSKNHNHENRIPLRKISANESDTQLFENQIPHELNFVTLRRPPKRLGRVQTDKDNVKNESENQSLRQSIERQSNHIPLRRQTSGSSSTCNLGNFNENETPVRIGLDYNMLKDRSTNGRKNTPLVKNGSNHSSFCSTLEDNDENSISEAQ